MKKKIAIIVIILLFILSGLIYWAGFAPVSFSKFFALYPVINQTAVQIGVLNPNVGNITQATSSEPVLSDNGQVTIGDYTWTVEVARDDKTRENGLSNRSLLSIRQGMLFAFDKMSPQFFWMKDMLFPLDMVFFDNNWKIVLIETDLQPSSFPKTFGSNVNSQYVLEMNEGEANSYGLKVGDQAIFLNK